MKMINHIQTIKFIIIGMAITFWQTSYADNTTLQATTDSTDTPLIVVDLTVTLDPDCTALHYCDWEVLVFDVSDCSQDNQPIATSDYKYGDPVLFSGLTFSNAKVRVCVRHKPGTPECTYPNYAPQCVCRTINSSTMNIPLDICNP
jgi:hypothetical protein